MRIALTDSSADIGPASVRRAHSRWWARLVVLCAFVVVVGAGVVIVRNYQSDTHSSKTSTASTVTPAARRLAHYWTVRSGNTLEEISLKTGLSIATLKADNPVARSGVIHPGQHLSLWKHHSAAHRVDHNT